MKYNIFTNSVLTVLMMFLLSVSAPVYAEDSDDRSVKHLDGELLLPEDYKAEDEKKCMTICDKWGEDCIISPRTGGRKCRRVCKSFAEECF